MSSTGDRFWEVDFSRGAAVLGMILFHSTFDLYFLEILFTEMNPAVWFFLAAPIVGTFLFLVGISMVISFERRKKTLTKKQMHRKYFLRGLKIFGYGLGITAVTWVFISSAYVVFGILHLIGVSVVLSYVLLRIGLNRKVYPALALVFIFVGAFLPEFKFKFIWLLWLGLRPDNFVTADYFPVFPWFGVVLLGLYFGRRFYGQERKFKLKEVSNSVTDFFCFLGRHSLLIYFLHQPVLVSVILLLT